MTPAAIVTTAIAKGLQVVSITDHNRIGNVEEGHSGAPGDSPIWTGLRGYSGRTKTDGDRYYEWDFTHGDIEVYNSRGEHLGSMHAVSGEMIKPAVRGRTIDL